MYKINTYYKIDTAYQQRCVNVVYDTTLPQLRCHVVVTLCVIWDVRTDSIFYFGN